MWWWGKEGVCICISLIPILKTCQFMFWGGGFVSVGILPGYLHLFCLHPFKSQYPRTNSPNWSLYISLKNELREFDKRSKHFLLGDHFINSHNLISWQSMDIVRRKLKFVTIGTQRVIAVAVSTHRLACSWCSDTSVVEHGGQMTGSELTPQFSSTWIFSSALLNASNRQPIFFVVSLHCITLYQACMQFLHQFFIIFAHYCLSICHMLLFQGHVTSLLSKRFCASSSKRLLRRLPCYMYLCN